MARHPLHKRSVALTGWIPKQRRIGCSRDHPEDFALVVKCYRTETMAHTCLHPTQTHKPTHDHMSTFTHTNSYSSTPTLAHWHNKKRTQYTLRTVHTCCTPRPTYHTYKPVHLYTTHITHHPTVHHTPRIGIPSHQHTYTPKETHRTLRMCILGTAYRILNATPLMHAHTSTGVKSRAQSHRGRMCLQVEPSSF